MRKQIRSKLSELWLVKWRSRIRPLADFPEEELPVPNIRKPLLVVAEFHFGDVHRPSPRGKIRLARVHQKENERQINRQRN